MTENAVRAPGNGAVHTATEASVLAIVEEVLGRRGIGPDGDLFDHGATSLSFVRVLGQIHQRLNAQVHPADLDDRLPSVTSYLEPRLLEKQVLVDYERPDWWA